MTKVISISDSAYKELSTIKNSRSFSEVILDLISLKKRSNVSEIFDRFFGVGGVDAESIKDLKKEWKKWSRRYA